MQILTLYSDWDEGRVSRDGNQNLATSYFHKTVINACTPESIDLHYHFGKMITLTLS